MHMFLFDDILLLTKVKKSARKVQRYQDYDFSEHINLCYPIL